MIELQERLHRARGLRVQRRRSPAAVLSPRGVPALPRGLAPAGRRARLPQPRWRRLCRRGVAACDRASRRRHVPSPRSGAAPSARRRDDLADVGVARDERRVAAAEREQLVVRAALDDRGRGRGRRSGRRRARSTGGARSRSPSAPPRAARAPPARPARSACRAPTSPRRGRGSAGCGGSSARSRCAASRRPRTGSRARRRPSRSPRGATRSGRGSAPARAASSTSSSVASGRAKRRFSRTVAWKRYVSCETTPTASVSESKVRSRTSIPSIATVPRVAS